MNAARPTILLVHGAWHKPDPHYKQLTNALEAASFDVVCPELPSANTTRLRTATLDDDVNAVKGEASRLVGQGRVVLVLAHSYGGVVITSAITQSMTLEARRIAGDAGGIVALVYMCAFMPRAGGCVADLVAGTGAPLRIDFAADGGAFPANPVEAFYADVDAGLARSCISALHVQPATTLLGRASAEAWRLVPVTYLHCTDDAAITLLLQQDMVAATRGAGGPEVRVETLECGHSPFLTSKNRDIVRFTREAWNAGAEKLDYKPIAAFLPGETIESPDVSNDEVRGYERLRTAIAPNV